MNARSFPFLSGLILIFSFICFAAAGAVSQTNRTPNTNFYYAPLGGNEKISGLNVVSPVKSTVNVGEIEHRVFDLINGRRAEAGLPPLTWNESVAVAARCHSEDMANNKFFSHTGFDGKKVAERAGKSGIKDWSALGENIAYNRGFKSPLESAVQSWMNSPGHGGNILKDGWDESGIGVVVTGDGTYYFTQVFLKK